MGDYLPFLFFGLIGAAFLYGRIRYGGFKASMFGARIRRTVGEIGVRKGALVRMKLKVHALEVPSTSEPRVGLELTTSAVLSYSMTPISLSQDEARELCQLLSDALGR